MAIKTTAQLPILTDKDGINLKLPSYSQIPSVMHLKVYDNTSYETDMQLMEAYLTKLGGAIQPTPENFFYEQIAPDKYKPKKLDSEVKNLIKPQFKDKSVIASLQSDEPKQIEKLIIKPIEGTYPYCSLGIGIGTDKEYGIFSSWLIDGNEPYKLNFKQKYKDKSLFPFKQKMNIEYTTNVLTAVMKEIYKACMKYEEMILDKENITDRIKYQVELASGLNPEPSTRILLVEGEMNSWFAKGLVVRAFDEVSKQNVYKSFCWLSEVNLETVRKKADSSRFSLSSLIKGWNKSEAQNMLIRWDAVDGDIMGSFDGMFDCMNKQMNVEQCRMDYSLSIIDLMNNENSLVMEE